MTKPTEAQLDAAYAGYYQAVNDWSVTLRGRVYIVEKRAPLLEVAPKNKTVSWRFEDKETADRFLITKILEAVTEAVVSV